MGYLFSFYFRACEVKEKEKEKKKRRSRRHALLSSRCLHSLIFSVYLAVENFLCMQNLILDFVLDSHYLLKFPIYPCLSNVNVTLSLIFVYFNLYFSYCIS